MVVVGAQDRRAAGRAPVDGQSVGRRLDGDPQATELGGQRRQPVGLVQACDPPVAQPGRGGREGRQGGERRDLVRRRGQGDVDGPQPGSGRGTVLTNGHTYRDGSAIFQEDFAERIHVGQLIDVEVDNGSTCSYRVQRVWRDVDAAQDYPRIVLAEDLYLLREGLIQLLRSYDFDIAAAVESGPDLLAALLEHRPDVAVVDVRLPPSFTDEGLRAALEARRQVPGLPVLVLSQYVEVSYADDLLADRRGGVNGAEATDLRDLAVRVAREAAALVRGRREHPVEVADTKSSVVDVVTEADRASEALIRSLLAQARPTPAGVSVHDVVSYGRHPYRGRWRSDDPDGARAIAHAMEVTGLADMADRGVDELSGGELQRVWLATCLAQDTGVLLLDEPTTFLDLRYQVEILDLIRDLADQHGVAVGVVLHDLDQAAADPDR